MRGVWLVILLAACGPTIKNDRPPSTVIKHIPASLEAARPREGDPKAIKIRIYVDAAVRAAPKWREELGDQLDYANQLLTPLIGAKLDVQEYKEWTRDGEPGAALTELTALDKGSDVTWVLGYVAANDVASKAMIELGAAEPLGHHVVVRGWAEQAETSAIAALLPDLKEAERAEIVAAHRRHKQTVVLLHWLAATLGAVDEADPTTIQHPTYSHKQTTFSERNRELMSLGVDERKLGTTDQNLAKRLLDAIEKTAYGGWVPTSQTEVTKRLKNIVDAGKSGRTAAAIPPAAYDQYLRIKQLAKQGKSGDALIELDNLLAAYPGNAAMHQAKCEIMLIAPGVKDKATRAACQKASDLAPGDPSPHLVVAEALAHYNIKDYPGARAQMLEGEDKIKNLPDGHADAWKKVIATYQNMGSLTWTEEAITKAKLENDPVAIQIQQTRSRYGVPRGAKFVAVDQEAALVAAIRASLDQVYASKYGEALKTIAAAEKKWPAAPGLAHARCDLALRQGQVGVASAACARALAGDPNDSWALYLSAILALKTAAGNQRGIELLKKTIAVDPELQQAWKSLAKVYIRVKDKPSYQQLAKDYQEKFGEPLPL
jgi:tetratricopeptide (TPR) repeat protein